MRIFGAVVIATLSLALVDEASASIIEADFSGIFQKPDFNYPAVPNNSPFTAVFRFDSDLGTSWNGGTIENPLLGGSINIGNGTLVLNFTPGVLGELRWNPADKPIDRVEVI
jgi:hypothetical protein